MSFRTHEMKCIGGIKTRPRRLNLRSRATRKTLGSYSEEIGRTDRWSAKRYLVDQPPEMLRDNTNDRLRKPRCGIGSWVTARLGAILDDSHCVRFSWLPRWRVQSSSSIPSNLTVPAHLGILPTKAELRRRLPCFLVDLGSLIDACECRAVALASRAI